MIEMVIKVKYYNLMQEALGIKEETFQTEQEWDLAKLMQAIVERHGAKARKMLYKGTATLAPDIRIFVDDKLVYNVSIPLKDDAEVALFYAVVGG